MNPDQRALLDNIRDNPHDDLARLVYADWLEENGQGGQGTFIRWHCGFEIDDVPTAKQIRKLFKTEAKILSKYFDVRRFAPNKELKLVERGTPGCGGGIAIRPVNSLTIRHGFIERVRCTMCDWVKHGANICVVHPVARVEFTDCHPYLSMAGNYYWGDGWEQNPEPNFNAIWEIPRGLFPPGAGRNMAYSSAELAFDDLSARSIVWARLTGNTPAMLISRVG